MESVLSGHKNQAWIKLTQEIKQVRQIMFLFFFLNMHVLSWWNFLPEQLNPEPNWVSNNDLVEENSQQQRNLWNQRER